MKKQHLIPCLALLSILLIHSPAQAGTFTAYGPKTFVRGSGKPVMEAATFNIKNPNTSYNLHIYNGGINSERSKVSSAIITLNGTTIFDTNDFNQQIAHLQKNVSVSKSNTLQAELRSTPGSGLAILLEGVDDTPPDVAITSPSSNTYLNTPIINVSGTASDSISWVNSVSINGAPVLNTGDTFTASNIRLTEGTNLITVEAVDVAGNKGTATTSVILDTTPPVITITAPIYGSIVNTGTITVTGTIDDNTATVTINGINAAVSNGTFTVTGISLTKGANTITVTATDTTGNTSTSAIMITYTLPGLPDPSTVAPPIDNTVATTLASATAFLYTGSDPIQTGVAPGTIEAKRAAVLRGKVTTNDGTPLSGVKITILNHPEYGSTKTREDGMFDMAVNGGGWITINYEKSGYLPAQRKVDVPWQDYAWVEDIVMIPFDTKVTAVNLSADIPIQVAQGSTTTDSDGTRKATLLFPQGTGATMKLPDGTWMSLTNINVRATEYTVGENGPKSMPAPLPPTSGYTYAAEFSIDEAVVMGATYVSFSKPVITYVENFLNFPVGGIVPVGWYDREKGVWIPSDNGKIIKILSITNGLADINIDGSNAPASSSALASFGITDSERQTLATLYQSGQSLWRVPISHFTPWDCNWPFGPPPDATSPALPEPTIDNNPDHQDEQCGSIIGCQGQTLGETINIIGTPFSLNYNSDRVPGRRTSYTLIPISGSTVPSSLKRIELEIEIAGRKITETFSASPNQTYNFTWDGKDAYGRKIQGIQPVSVRIGFVYGAVYRQPGNAAQSFGAVPGSPITGSRARQEITIWQENRYTIGAWDARGHGLGSWTLDIQHSYEPLGRVLYLGNGKRRSTENIGRVISTLAGNGSFGYRGDGGPATDAVLNFPYGVATDSKGNVYIADVMSNRIRKVDTDGIISTIAGTGSQGYSGDGGAAINASFNRPYGVAVDSEGNIYIAERYSNRIRKVDTDGIITTGVRQKSW